MPGLDARIISINLGVPRSVQWERQTYLTAIFKNPVKGRVRVRRLGLLGDAQADLTVHGGPNKAVYAYPSEHYAAWREKLRRDLGWGAFGENLTTEGLLESSVRVGDRLTAGSAEFIVTSPRFPCFKLGIRFGTMEMVKRFQDSGWSGFYLAVSKEGEIEAGDSIRLINSDRDKPTIADIFASER
jgi:MOSC domain-containing protein YiiM